MSDDVNNNIGCHSDSVATAVGTVGPSYMKTFNEIIARKKAGLTVMYRNNEIVVPL